MTEEMIQEESSEDIVNDNDRWDALMETDGAQFLAEKLADDALKELRDGKTYLMSFNDEGQIVPE